MNKCLNCQYYKKNGKIHRCSKNPGIVVYSETFPLEPLKESCVKFQQYKFKESVSPLYRKMDL